MTDLEAKRLAYIEDRLRCSFDKTERHEWYERERIIMQAIELQCSQDFIEQLKKDKDY